MKRLADETVDPNGPLLVRARDRQTHAKVSPLVSRSFEDLKFASFPEKPPPRAVGLADLDLRRVDVAVGIGEVARMTADLSELDAVIGDVGTYGDLVPGMGMS
ncbi:hypothetical protein [Paludisphaera rhizosphaerae]|uniref:hypothetical protein n=1 Tax=Paludisphaera rhizosphaerae TaxID=2711216 RepID=UPI001F118133|nr:hypothetical protein [Paludisphaera rhizosphaerae]